VGGTGRTFIAIGLLLFAFVGYQLWGTGIEQARAQDDLEARFRQLQAQLTNANPTTTVGPATTVGALAPAASPATRPTAPTDAGTVPATSPAPSGPATTAAPTAVGPATTAVAPVVAVAPAAPPEFRPGDPIALMKIPRLGVTQTIVSGVGRADLQRGPGHFRTTPLPGGMGNAAIAGHRTTFGEPFRHLDDLEPGDRIELTDVLGRRFLYLVQWSRVVPPTDLGVIESSGQPELTLITCDPPFTAAKRLIVRARLVDGEPNTAPPTPAVVPERAPVGGPATTLPEEPEDDPGPGAGVTPERPPGTAPGAPAAPGAPGRQPAAESLDGFEQGWFSDTAAWPHVAAWGSVLAIVAILAWVLSGLSRRDWIGALAGIGPFAVILYFFFQNVNRLLPAGF
jgi:sortase A